MPKISFARWWIFATVLVADVLDLLDATVTNIAAPSIIDDLHAPPSLVPWLGLSYALALGSLLIIGGRLGDRFGTRRTFLVGLVGFAVTSTGVALSWDPTVLIAFRLAQGCFGALLIPQGFSILLRVFPRHELGRVFSIFGPLLALSSISGPMLAGLLLRLSPFGLGWRSIFAITAALGLVLVVVAMHVLPADTGDSSVKIEPLPSALIMLGVMAALGGVISGGESGWTLRPIALVLTGLALLGAFVASQRRSDTPLLVPSLFRNAGFVAGTTVGTLFFAAVSGLLYLTSLFLQVGQGLPALTTAVIMAPLSVGIITTSFGLRSRIQRLGRRLVAAGVALVAAGVLADLALLPRIAETPGIMAAPLLFIGLGMGCCFGSLFATALGDVEPDQAGSASGTLNALQQVANATGAAVVSTLFLALLATSGAVPAARSSSIAVLVILTVCAASLPLLPRRAAASHH